MSRFTRCLTGTARLHYIDRKEKQKGKRVDYEWDVFISYCHSGHVKNWVINHFHNELKLSLEDELPHDPRIFIDYEIPVGSPWPDRLAEALARSRCLVPIWSPPYFRSEWCLAEWTSMRARQEVVKNSANKAPILIYPIIFSDGDHFPDDAKNTQHCRNLSEYGHDREQFRDTPDYLAFQKEMRTVAKEISDVLQHSPTWQAEWPMERSPNIPNQPLTRLPRL
ncbi:toll/interleukin-1 receptor domain-containing protein [Streptomyces sp. SID6648]|nr:toll/interleukin-1 receptor domain-containing protein [Streptomyces sp. SID6648]